MPHEYTDNEDRPPPFNEAAASESGVNGGGGYAVPVPVDYTLRGYQSLAVMLDGHGGPVTVEVGWRHSDDVAGIVMLDTKVQASSDPSALFFVNHGDILDHVTLTGGGNIDYSVVESNQLPLPHSAAGAAPDYIILTGVGHAIPAVVGGDSGQVPWDETNYVTNDASLWTFTLDGAGHIVQVNTTQLGRYEALAGFVFAAPAASTEEDFSVSMANVVGGNRTVDAFMTTAKPYAGMVAIFGESSGVPSIFECDYSLDTATTSNIRGQWLWIKRWAL